MDSVEVTERALQDLLGADCVLPEQFWTSQRRVAYRTGERALMWAVFADGIDAFRRNAHARSLRRRAEFKEALQWMLSTDWDWPFSFVNLCETFGFDPQGVRRKLRLWKQEHHPRPFRRQRFRPVTLHAA